MKLKSMVLLAVAVGCGLVAMVGVKQVLSRDEAPAEEYGKVLVAAVDISPGVPLNDGNSGFKKMALSAIPQNAVTKREDYENRSLRLAAVSGEVILASKLGKPGQHGGSMEIPPGYRVGTVSVNTTKTHSGLILPGDFVDVVVTYKPLSGGGRLSKTKTVLEYIQVFATDNVRKSGVSADATEMSAKNISLLVSPEQYNLLMQAETMGEITLALRNRNDDAVVDSEPVDSSIFEDLAADYGGTPEEESSPPSSIQDFLNKHQADAGQTPAVVVEPTRPMWTIRIYEGNTTRDEQVELPEPESPEPSAAEAALPSGGGLLQGWLQQVLTGA